MTTTEQTGAIAASSEAANTSDRNGASILENPGGFEEEEGLSLLDQTIQWLAYHPDIDSHAYEALVANLPSIPTASHPFTRFSLAIERATRLGIPLEAPEVLELCSAIEALDVPGKAKDETQGMINFYLAERGFTLSAEQRDMLLPSAVWAIGRKIAFTVAYDADIANLAEIITGMTMGQKVATTLGTSITQHLQHALQPEVQHKLDLFAAALRRLVTEDPTRMPIAVMSEAGMLANFWRRLVIPAEIGTVFSERHEPYAAMVVDACVPAISAGKHARTKAIAAWCLSYALGYNNQRTGWKTIGIAECPPRIRAMLTNQQAIIAEFIAFMLILTAKSRNDGRTLPASLIHDLQTLLLNYEQESYVIIQSVSNEMLTAGEINAYELACLLRILVHNHRPCSLADKMALAEMQKAAVQSII